MSYQIKEKNHKMIMDIEENIMIDVDPIRIFHVFTNLISNAIKFTPNNGIIEISAKKVNDKFNFCVIDNGLGLTEIELEKIFQKFVNIKQDDDVKRAAGTGLGLYISKGIIEAHGGKICATSEGRNKGTTLSFLLPC